jgi:hypothetical protein
MTTLSRRCNTRFRCVDLKVGNKNEQDTDEDNEVAAFRQVQGQCREVSQSCKHDSSNVNGGNGVLTPPHFLLFSL